FVDTEAVRVIAANPGSDLFPSADLPYPYGFGTLPEELSDDRALRRYLAQPLTLYLGTADTVADKNFDQSEQAKRQGASRYERGRNACHMAETLAREKGWKFNWRLVEAPDVAHNARAMFHHPRCETALFGDQSKD